MVFGFSLISHLSPEEYWFSGQVTRAGAVSSPAPLVISCSFLNNGGHLLAEGSYRFSQTDTSHKFALSFESFIDESTPIRLTAGHTGELLGQLYARSESFLALLTGRDGDAICCEIQLLDDNALRLSGAVHVRGAEFAFVATGSPDTDRVTLGNVVSISGGKRA